MEKHSNTDDWDCPWYNDFMYKPLLGNRLSEIPKPKGGLHFVCSTINDDGDPCETWSRKWSFLGMTVEYETHDSQCNCSYCEWFTKRIGISFPKCGCWNSLRVFYWRKKHWPCQLSCIKWDLPRIPFKWWKCRHCRKSNIDFR